MLNDIDYDLTIRTAITENLDRESRRHGYKMGLDVNRVSALPEFFNEAQAELWLDLHTALQTVDTQTRGGLLVSDTTHEQEFTRDGVTFKVTIEAVI